MSNRHVFKGGLLCEERFGGVAACALPPESPWHWSDADHPYIWPSDDGVNCVWLTDHGEPCGLGPEDDRHKNGSELPAPRIVVQFEGTVPPPRLREAETVQLDLAEHLEDLAAEGERERRELPLYGGDSPDGGTWGGHVDGSEYSWGLNAEASVRSEMASVAAAEWERAVEWLTSEDTELKYGPWPVRKFVLMDMNGDALVEMRACLGALDALEKEYVVAVTRSEGAPYRVALVTWDMLLGLSVEAACDELAALYG
jgi:hypothetical protein